MLAANEQQKELSAIENWRVKPVNLDRGLDALQLSSVMHNHFYPDEWKKERIVLHYTPGSFPGDIQTLTLPKKVSVAYLIGRTGQIISLFPDKYWAWHLGETAIGGNKEMSRTSIGIELTNWGWLKESAGSMWTYNKLQFCSADQTDLYVRDKPFRDQSTWATFTDDQYVSLKKLLTYLTDKYKIPYTFLPESERLEVTKKATAEKGIFTHVNYRDRNKYGNWDKWDLGPAFDFSRIAP